MAWKVLSQLKHGELYEVGAVIHQMEAKAAAELVKAGVLEDLNTGQPQEEPNLDAKPEPDKKPESENTGQPQEEQPLERDKVDEQLQENLKKDLADNEAIAQTEGKPVENNSPNPG